jgi:hypothetical protein
MIKKHRYIKVNYDDYVNYIRINHHNRLDRWNRIWTPEKTVLLEHIFGKINEEIFNGQITTYKVEVRNDDFIIDFETDSKTKYRFDLSKEPINNIYHLSFSLYDLSKENENDYESLTNKGESFEVLNRLIWILKDFSNSLPDNSEFCIGFSENEKKNKIYAYMIRGLKNWKKRETHFYKTGWGIYFKI